MKVELAWWHDEVKAECDVYQQNMDLYYPISKHAILFAFDWSNISTEHVLLLLFKKTCQIRIYCLTFKMKHSWIFSKMQCLWITDFKQDIIDYWVVVIPWRHSLILELVKKAKKKVVVLLLVAISIILFKIWAVHGSFLLLLLLWYYIYMYWCIPKHDALTRTLAPKQQIWFPTCMCNLN